jgi:predicted lipid-binding transport protein (Tim44 family)
MKKMLVAIMLVAAGATAVVGDADAKRLGGGGSIGRQSQSLSRQAPAPAAPMQRQQATPNQAPPAAAPAPRPASPWRGILGGALLGLGLGALFSHLGIGGAMAGMLSTILTFALIALAIMFVVRLIRSKQQPSYAGYGNAGNQGYARNTPEIGSRVEPSAFTAQQPASGGAQAASQPFGVPADFDVQSFLRHAKTYFIRLQAAWDKADVNDLREFTTPEMYAELKMQIQERGPAANVTDVVSINADLLGMEEQAGEYVASVRFEGMIREAANAPTEHFSEVWNLVKPVNGSGGWVLAGIQQLA